jgi:hypothetical protein
LQQGRKIQLVDDMHGAVATPGAEDGFDLRIIEHLLKIGESFRIGATVYKIFFPNGIAGFCLKPPAFDLLNGGLDFLQGDITGGTGNADGIAGLQIRRDQQGLGRFFRRLPGVRRSIGTEQAGPDGADGEHGGKKVFSIHISKINRILFKESPEHG